MDGDGGRGMSLSEVRKLTLAQAMYFLRSKRRKEISKAEANQLQQRQSESTKKRNREKMQALINWASGVK
jgi:hypothetical protein